MHDTINGAMFKEMLLFGTVSIAQAQQAINDLNVFPVPDGDTGTNMSLTIQTAAQELKKIEPATVDQAASVTASALLRGARGRDCASCHLAGGFDYKSTAPVKPADMKRKEIVTDTGHLIIVDEEAAKRRRERIRKMMEGK